jgi:hypothetical protein
MRKHPPLFSLETHQANQIRSLKRPEDRRVVPCRIDVLHHLSMWERCTKWRARPVNWAMSRSTGDGASSIRTGSRANEGPAGI